jgi:hypothetical protein
VPLVGAPAQLRDGAKLADAGAGTTTAASIPSIVAAAAVSAARLVSLIAILLRIRLRVHAGWRIAVRVPAGQHRRPLSRITNRARQRFTPADRKFPL